MQGKGYNRMNEEVPSDQQQAARAGASTPNAQEQVISMGQPVQNPYYAQQAPAFGQAQSVAPQQQLYASQQQQQQLYASQQQQSQYPVPPQMQAPQAYPLPQSFQVEQGVRVGDFPNHLMFAVPKEPTSRYTQTIFCNHCRRPIDSVVRYEVGTGSFLIGTLLCFILPYGCCLGPCVIDDCKDAIHLCSGCGSVLGKKKFIFE